MVNAKRPYLLYKPLLFPSVDVVVFIHFYLSLSLVSFRVLMIATDQKITTREMAKEERTGEKKECE